MTLTKLHITARLVAIIMAVISVATTKAQEIYRVESAPAAVQLRSNGLYDLALCPNIGIEIQTDLGMAVGLYRCMVELTFTQPLLFQLCFPDGDSLLSRQSEDDIPLYGPSCRTLRPDDYL